VFLEENYINSRGDYWDVLSYFEGFFVKVEAMDIV
jgi:hypothetical protein